MSIVQSDQLTGAAFRSSDNVSGITAFKKKVRYIEVKIVGASTEDREERIRSAITMAMIRNKNSERSIDEVADALGYIITGTYLLFPEMQSYMERSSTGNYDPMRITVSAAPYERLMDSIDEESETRSTSAGEEPHGSTSVQLPEMNLEIDLDDLLSNPREVAGRWSLEMFPIGKNVSPDNMDAFRIKRIKSLKGRLTIEGTYQHPFSDEFLPTIEVLKSVERAFTLNPAFRLGFANYWVRKVIAGAQSEMEDAYLVLFRMTDGYGFSSPTFIADFIHAHPAARQFQELKPACTGYQSAFKTFLTEPANTRGFLKVRFGSNHKLFASSTKGALLACAVAFKSQTDASAKNFMDITPYIPSIERLNAFLIKHGEDPIVLEHTAGSSLSIAEA